MFKENVFCANLNSKKCVSPINLVLKAVVVDETDISRSSQPYPLVGPFRELGFIDGRGSGIIDKRHNVSERRTHSSRAGYVTPRVRVCYGT
ncbi:hypothetical protein M422DRAFT_37899 [Sphaerobolus stellatus SS14]|uniref:Uncharacterized protein n=1 Tax=Sphaerobolus stellatus (strain SS14) TaxID=990650 RepID=A0A0C9TZG8_SPHS4|nr:hypothetical protein M422DRAFT_37899 [Sphaerobolus stellatus SS14]